MRHLILLETSKILYYSLFYSFVSYGITAWGLAHKSYLDPIIIAQKKILRVMTFSEINAHTASLSSQLGILNVHEAHQFQLLSFVYDCHDYKLAPIHFHSYFNPIHYPGGGGVFHLQASKLLRTPKRHKL